MAKAQAFNEMLKLPSALLITLLCLLPCSCTSRENAGFSDEQMYYAYHSDASVLDQAKMGNNEAVSLIFQKSLNSELDGEYAELYGAQLYQLAQTIGSKRFIELLVAEPNDIQTAIADFFLPVVERDRRLSDIRNTLLKIKSNPSHGE